VALDLGDPTSPKGSVHSRHKEEVGRRLALQWMHAAYAKQYKENLTNIEHPSEGSNATLVFSGPEPRTALASSSTQVTITFEYTDGMKVNATLACSECCSACNTFRVLPEGTNTWENASYTVQGSMVVLTTRTSVTAVRYNDNNYPECALINSAGIATGTFELAVGGLPQLVHTPNRASNSTGKTPYLGTTMRACTQALCELQHGLDDALLCRLQLLERAALQRGRAQAAGHG